MAHVQFEERQAAVKSTAAQMVWNLTVRAESEALKVIGENHSVSSQALMSWIQRRREIRSEKKEKRKKKKQKKQSHLSLSLPFCVLKAQKGGRGEAGENARTKQSTPKLDSHRTHTHTHTHTHTKLSTLYIYIQNRRGDRHRIRIRRPIVELIWSSNGAK